MVIKDKFDGRHVNVTIKADKHGTPMYMEHVHVPASYQRPAHDVDVPLAPVGSDQIEVVSASESELIDLGPTGLIRKDRAADERLKAAEAYARASGISLNEVHARAMADLKAAGRLPE